MICVGIDVAKDKHDCFILSSEGESPGRCIHHSKQCRGL